MLTILIIIYPHRIKFSLHWMFTLCFQTTKCFLLGCPSMNILWKHFKCFCYNRYLFFKCPFLNSTAMILDTMLSDLALKMCRPTALLPYFVVQYENFLTTLEWVLLQLIFTLNVSCPFLTLEFAAKIIQTMSFGVTSKMCRTTALLPYPFFCIRMCW